MIKKIEDQKKVFVAMSGGVDSSIAALLLKKQGYEVVGVFMKFWMGADTRGLNADTRRPAENHCCFREARRDAMRVCTKLNIPLLTWDFQKEFKKAVVDDFISGYKKGITPNPCVICNKKIKFGLFIKKALQMGADYVATGHYVRLARSEKQKAESKTPFFAHRYSLFAARDAQKDQSYFLWPLTQKQLKHCLFPLGNYSKEEVRYLAKKYKLPVALKKESQEVCFMKDTDLYGFLKRRIHTKKGAIIELRTGKKIGEHQGIQFYTIGQRVPVGGTGPYYVVAKNLKKNQLIVIKKEDKKLFFEKEITLKNVNWLSAKSPRLPLEIMVRTRYRQPLVKCQMSKVKSQKSKFVVVFKKPQIFVAPGQSAVFYGKNGELLGGGVIKGFL